MKYEAYYLIRPKERLARRLSASPSDMADILLETRLWSCGEGGRTVWGTEEYEAKVKLLFVANLVSEYSHDADFHQLFDDLTVSVEVFDTWWSLERYTVDETCETIESQLSPAVVNSIVEPSVPLVDKWVSYLREKVSGRDV